MTRTSEKKTEYTQLVLFCLKQILKHVPNYLDS